MFGIGIVLFSALFAKTYGGTYSEEGYSVIQTQEGDYISVGYVVDGYVDFSVIRFSSDGSLSDAKRFGGSGWDEAYSVAATQDGGFVVAGETGSFGVSGFDFLVMRMASDGSLIWSKTYGAAYMEHPYSIIQNSDGGYTVVGETNSIGAGFSDFLVLRLGSDGSVLWARTFGGENEEEAWSAIETPDGRLVVAGWTDSYGAGNDDLLILKLNPDGSPIWTKTLGGIGDERAFSVAQAHDGGYVVAGWTGSFGAGGTDFLVVKLGQDGSLIWAKTFGGNRNDWAQSIVATSDGGYLVSGTTFSFGADSSDALMIKLGPDGSLIWARRFGGQSYDYAYSSTQARDGDYVVVGTTWSFGAGAWDFLVIKIGQNGEYANCVQACYPVSTNVNPTTSSPLMGFICNLDASSPTLTPTPLNLIAYDICPTLASQDTKGSSGGPCCFAFSEGAVFFAQEPGNLRLYSTDGRLICCRHLETGYNRITLKPGVYIWRASSEPTSSNSRACTGRIAIPSR
ncbi:MAG: delta-60 repeat domain-containing protein [candidate division WOR-3 bacterium]